MTVNEQYWEQRHSIDVQADEYARRIQQKRGMLEAWLKEQQKQCRHKDAGGMFYLTCRECGLTGD